MSLHHHLRRIALALVPLAFGATIAAAQDLPVIETEAGEIETISVGEGKVHPFVILDIRNGDYSRGEYDDDAAGLGRIPFHAQVGLGVELHRNAEGEADAVLVLRSSNGFHDPGPIETGSPRTWYESNNLIGLVLAPSKGLGTSISYTIKTSPNDVSPTTHELTGVINYDADTGLGRLHPHFLVTVQPRGGDGVYTQAGIEPEFELRSGDNGPKLHLPLRVGIGWDDFYDEGAGTAVFGSAGAAVSVPFDVGSTRWTFRGEAVAQIRDDRLRQLGGPQADRETIVPVIRIGLTAAY